MPRHTPRRIPRSSGNRLVFFFLLTAHATSFVVCIFRPGGRADQSHYFRLCHLIASRDRLRYCMIKSLSMEAIMKAVTISPKFQIVIPRELRKSMDIQPGAKVQILQYENRIELIPIKSPKSLRGLLKRIDTTVDRELDRV